MEAAADRPVPRQMSISGRAEETRKWKPLGRGMAA